MEALRHKILKEGEVLSSTILKVDSFLNHQIDPSLMMEIGKKFAELFHGEKITKIVTLEASGIAPALATAMVLGVPVVFAKKTKATTMDEDVYKEEVKSFTRNTVHEIKIAKKFLSPEDHVLVIDDFLAYGYATLGLTRIVQESGAKMVGVGIVIEKGFQPGGRFLADQGIRVESLAIIDGLENGKVLFREETL